LFTAVAAPDEGGRYGLGVAIVDRGTQVSYGHTGSIPGYRAALRYFPARGITVAVQFNADEDGLLLSLGTAALEAAEQIQLAAPTAFTGIRCAESGRP
jgi:hypothetical protein